MVITRALGRERTPNNRRGTGTITHAPGATTVRVVNISPGANNASATSAVEIR